MRSNAPAPRLAPVDPKENWPVADFVAARLDLDADDLLPTAVGHLALAKALTAYERWLADPDASLLELIDATKIALDDFSQG